MEKKNLISTSEAARILGISRVAVFQRIKKGQIEAIKVGRNYVIDRRSLGDLYQEATPRERDQIDRAVDRVVEEYGDVLKRLGKE
jgi:excisionase family DNA binding protein